MRRYLGEAGETDRFRLFDTIEEGTKFLEDEHLKVIAPPPDPNMGWSQKSRSPLWWIGILLCHSPSKQATRVLVRSLLTIRQLSFVSLAPHESVRVRNGDVYIFVGGQCVVDTVDPENGEVVQSVMRAPARLIGASRCLNS